MRPLDHGGRSLGAVDSAEADLADDPDAFLGEVFEVLLDQTLLEDQSAAFDLHAGNALGKALVADNGLRLGVGRVALGMPGDMAFAGRDHSGHAAVFRTLNEAEGLLTGAVAIRRGDMHMRVPETRGDGGAVRINDGRVADVGEELLSADCLDEVLVDDDDAALKNGVVDVTGNDFTDVLNYQSSHGKLPSAAARSKYNLFCPTPPALRSSAPGAFCQSTRGHSAVIRTIGIWRRPCPGGFSVAAGACSAEPQPRRAENPWFPGQTVAGEPTLLFPKFFRSIPGA